MVALYSFQREHMDEIYPIENVFKMFEFASVAYMMVRSGAPNRHIILIDMFLVPRQCCFKLVKLEEEENTNMVGY